MYDPYHLIISYIFTNIMKPYLDTFGMIAHIFQPGRVGHTAKRFAASIGEGVVISAQLMQPWA